MPESELPEAFLPPKESTENVSAPGGRASRAPNEDRPTDDEHARKPWLEVYVDVPNVEHSTSALNWPTLINYGQMGRELAMDLPAGPYYLKRVWCFASTRDFDPVTGVGKLSSQPNVAHLRAIQASAGGITELVLSHRLPPRRGDQQWEEKGVDTNLAARLIEGACDNRYSAAVVISNDSDFAGVIRRVSQRGKTVFWGYFDRQIFENEHLKNAANKTYLLNRTLIRKCEWR